MKYRIFSIIAALSTLLAVSCQKADGEVEYGNTLIYMPQASVSGGIDNYYRVPSGDAENTANFRADEQNVYIYLGVLRSGKQKGEAFSVDVTVNDAASNAAASALSAVVLGTDKYELPANVSVEAGKNAVSFNLTISKETLASLGNKTYVLAVELANPSKYELGAMKQTVIVLNAKALLEKLN